MKRHLFNVEIIETNVDDIDNEKFSQWIQEQYKDKGTYDRPLGYSEGEDTPLPMCEEIEKLFAHAQKTLADELNAATIPQGYWAQVHEKGMSTNTHAHLPADVAGVYYVQTPEKCGWLAFEMDPIPPEFTEPKVGKMVLFPAWLKHHVTRNQSNERRISVSFNLGITGTANTDQ